MLLEPGTGGQEGARPPGEASAPAAEEGAAAGDSLVRPPGRGVQAGSLTPTEVW